MCVFVYVVSVYKRTHTHTHSHLFSYQEFYFAKNKVLILKHANLFFCIAFFLIYQILSPTLIYICVYVCVCV